MQLFSARIVMNLPAIDFRLGETPLIRRPPRTAQIGDRERDDLGGGAQVVEAQVLVGIVRVRLEDRARRRSVAVDRLATRLTERAEECERLLASTAK